MKRGIKIIFWIVGLIAALPAGLFIIGFIGGLTGSQPPTTPEPLQEITSEKLKLHGALLLKHFRRKISRPPRPAAQLQFYIFQITMMPKAPLAGCLKTNSLA